jgi:hypothetical protein
MNFEYLAIAIPRKDIWPDMDAVTGLLNQHAAQGWQLKQVIHLGQTGTGMLILERPAAEPGKPET